MLQFFWVRFCVAGVTPNCTAGKADFFYLGTCRRMGGLTPRSVLVLPIPSLLPGSPIRDWLKSSNRIGENVSAQ